MPLICALGIVLCILVMVGNVITLNRCLDAGGKPQTPVLTTVCVKP